MLINASSRRSVTFSGSLSELFASVDENLALVGEDEYTIAGGVIYLCEVEEWEAVDGSLRIEGTVQVANSYRPVGDRTPAYGESAQRQLYAPQWALYRD